MQKWIIWESSDDGNCWNVYDIYTTEQEAIAVHTELTESIEPGDDTHYQIEERHTV